VRARLLLPLVAASCTGISVEDTNVDGPVTESGGLVDTGVVDGDGDGDDDDESADDGDPAACGEIHDGSECLAAGCVPLEIEPIVVGAATEGCTADTPMTICSPADEAQDCDDARVCAGLSTWVMPLPDGAAWVARVEVSCGLPEGFRPCPETIDGDRLMDANAAADTTTGGDVGEDPLVAACECACS
jgi:hypothetical protein